MKPTDLTISTLGYLLKVMHEENNPEAGHALAAIIQEMPGEFTHLGDPLPVPQALRHAATVLRKLEPAKVESIYAEFLAKKRFQT